MKLVSENWQYLDFPNCDFFIKHVNTGDIIPAKFKSPEEFIKKSGELLARFCANFQILHRKNRTF